MKHERLGPRLGRMRSASSRRGCRYLGAVLKAAGRAGGLKRGVRRRFHGGRIGRGVVAVRILALRGQDLRAHSRRAIVKTRLARLAGKGLAAAGAHLRYIQRDGASRNGELGQLYSAADDRTDGKLFLKRCSGDRHQFRVIVSAEDGAEYEGLKPLIRRFMGQMEEDLGTKLEWVAADHVDTRHPHTHIVLRGKDEKDENLVIAPDYIKHGMCERAADIVSIDLGPKSDLEIRRAVRFDVEAERLTSIERRLLEGMDAAMIVAPHGRTMFDHAILTGRLRKLQSLGLADHIGGGHWRLDEQLEPVLRQLGERSDIMRIMQRVLSAARIERAASQQKIFHPGCDQSITGRLVTLGRSDELNRHYLVIDAIDGRSHYVELPRGEATEHLAQGGVVRVNSSKARPIEVKLLSALGVERLHDAEGATWLDRKLVGEDAEPVRDCGFGREVRSSLALRRAWLVDQGLASNDQDLRRIAPKLLAELQRREVLRVAAQLSAESGKDFAELNSGSYFNGVVRRRLDLISGRFLLVENNREFALVPWKGELEKAIGRELAGLAKPRAAIAWGLTRERGIEL